MSPFCEHCGKMFFPFGDTIRSVKFTATKDVVLVHGTGDPDGINTGKECVRVFDAAVESGRWEDFLDGPIRRAFAKAQEENDLLHADHPYDLCPDGGPCQVMQPEEATR